MISTGRPSRAALFVGLTVVLRVSVRAVLENSDQNA